MRELIFADDTTVDCESFVKNEVLGRLYLTVFTTTMADALTLFSDSSKLSTLRFEESTAIGYTVLGNVGLSIRPGGFDIILRKETGGT